MGREIEVETDYTYTRFLPGDFASRVRFHFLEDDQTGEPNILFKMLFDNFAISTVTEIGMNVPGRTMLSYLYCYKHGMNIYGFNPVADRWQRK